MGVKPVVVVSTGDPLSPSNKQAKIASCRLTNRPGRSNHCGVGGKLGRQGFEVVAINDNHMFNIAAIFSQTAI